MVNSLPSDALGDKLNSTPISGGRADSAVGSNQTNAASKPAAQSVFAFASKLNFGWGSKLPLLLQTEAAECGLASLAMVAGYHGYKVDLAILRSRFSISLKGATLKQLIEIAQTIGFTTRPLRLELEELSDLQTPCVLHWELNHFVVLKKVLPSGKGIVIHDPARGERTIGTKEVSERFTGVALELIPNAKFERKSEEQTVSIRQLLGKVVGLKRSMAQILALSLALEVFAVLSPFFTQWVVDGAIVSGDKDLLALLAIGFALVMVIQTTISTARSWVVLYLSSHLNIQWLGNVFGHLMRLPMAYFEKRHLGDIVSRFQSVHNIQHTLTTGFIEGILDGLMAITMLVIMFIYSPLLTWIVLASVFVYGLIRWAAYGPMRRIAEEQIALSAKEQSVFLESIRAVQTIKLFCHEDERRARWMNAMVESMNRGIASQKLGLGFGVANSMLSGAENIAVVWIGALLVMDTKLSVGMLFAFVSYKATFSGRVFSLVGKFIELKMLKLQAQRLADIVLTPTEHAQVDQTTSQINFNAISNRIPELELRNVSFRYADAEPWILKDVSLSIARGESVAITGPSGCGKSTLLKIILGLIQPTNGEVLYRGHSITKLAKLYRERLAAVMQDDQLISGSIGDNIRFFDEARDTDRMHQCAVQACIANEILAMPMQYETLVGDMGASLSGGQKQRLILARAMYARPSVLVMDEPTSDLDESNELTITRNLRHSLLTIVLVTHRPAPLHACDRIIDLQRNDLPSIDGSYK